MNIDDDGLHPFVSYVFRKYYQATGWNLDNQYSNLERSSDALLDFVVPRGLQFSISKAPNSLFRTTYCLNALPALNGSIGYVFSSCDLNLKNSGNVPFKDVVDRFEVYQIPKRPEGKEQEWLAGKRVDTRDYLLSGQLFIPTGQLNAYYTTRWSPTLQASISCTNNPNTSLLTNGNGSENRLLLSLQQDSGRWGSEYSWDSDGCMFGVRVLRNLGKLANAEQTPEDASAHSLNGLKRVDEEDAMEGGLKGRISVGAELFLSPDSAGVSTGFRFTTLPESSSSLDTSGSRSSPTQPPTTITALLNPLVGHLTTTYAARLSQDLALSSRFNFNVYNYEGEWIMGGEWWMRRKKTLSDSGVIDITATGYSQNEDAGAPLTLATTDDDIQGVVKARLSTSADIAFMWEGRIRNALVSLGVKSNLADRSKPIKALGLELAYFSSDDNA